MRVVDSALLIGSVPRGSMCGVAGCSSAATFIQGHPATDGGAELWQRCARHLVHPTFIPLVMAGGLPPACEVEVGGSPCGAMATHASLYAEQVGTTQWLGIVSACTRHAVRAW